MISKSGASSHDTRRTDDADTCALDVRFVAKNLLAGSGSGGEGLSGAGKKSRSPQLPRRGTVFSTGLILLLAQLCSWKRHVRGTEIHLTLFAIDTLAL